MTTPQCLEDGNADVQRMNEALAEFAAHEAASVAKERFEKAKDVYHLSRSQAASAEYRAAGNAWVVARAKYRNIKYDRKRIRT